MGDIRLPRSGKEGLLYGFIIALITAFIMLILNIRTSFGKIDLKVFLIILKTWPIMIVIAMILETFVVGRIAAKLVEKFSEPSDGFNARILFTILFCVTGMSITMTIIGGMIGLGKLSLIPFKTFFVHWPRNFCVAFWCEVLLAQPTSRFVMKKLHSYKENKKGENYGK